VRDLALECSPVMELFKTALMITGFVLAMMLLIEYLNVLTAGKWQDKLAGYFGGQYVPAALLGVMPGCLGAFTAVALYSHGVLTLGALVTTMIVTSGDEAFVMLALIPRHALALMSILFVLGPVIGVMVDALSRRRKTVAAALCFELHGPDGCECFPRERILAQWRKCSPVRGILTVVLGLFLVGIVAGQLGPAGWNWIRVSLVAVSALAFFIVATVPDHFLQEHLWGHVVIKHAPHVFLWTFSALIAMYMLTNIFHVEPAVRSGKWIVLLIACLVGLIPESGPHLIFVTMFAEGVVPFSILLASSIVQDGHGMLPMLAHSRREFLLIKTVNFTAGVSIGAAAMAIGW
jgi:hypothetical protein